MKSTTSLSRLLMATAILFLGSTLSFADVLEAPSEVQADETGAFAFALTFTAGSEVATLAYYEIDGTDNTDIEHSIADIYCALEVSPRESLVIPFSGHLLDLRATGIVDAYVSTCSARPLHVQIEVLPPRSESTLEGPAEITANPDGSFSYRATFTVGRDGVALASSERRGGANTVVPHIISDGYCLTPLQAGDQFEIGVQGPLQDLNASGVALVSVTTCFGQTFESFDLTTVVWPGPGFLRGDVDSDGQVTSVDATILLKYEFHQGREPGCLEAADANGDGRLDTEDAIFLVLYSLLDGPPPPAPFPGCGPDRQPGRSLGCESSNCSP